MSRPPHTTPSVMVCVAFILVIANFATMKALAQSSNAAMAKQHYEKATAATAKDDWTTAKNELIQATQLVPNNALIHYDLALAYSHTGQKKLAQLELDKALRLGLPPEQQADAVRLKVKLSTGSEVGPQRSHNETSTSDPRIESVHKLNSLIKSGLGLVNNSYRADGFTLETSTGKLMWYEQRSQGCSSGWLSGGYAGARLSELDSNSVAYSAKGSQKDIVIGCQSDPYGRRRDCYEGWASTYCGDASISGSWPIADAVDVISREGNIATVDEQGKTVRTDKSPLIFKGRSNRLEIITTGDDQAGQEAVELLKTLIASATKDQVDITKKNAATFLATNATKEGVVTLPSGLQYKVLVAGTGPRPSANDTVVCNYRGTFLDNSEFDSSYKKGQPMTILVSAVIKGWTEALQLMPVGSKWQLFIPPDLAHGERGAGLIGSNAVIIYEVELLSIQTK